MDENTDCTSRFQGVAEADREWLVRFRDFVENVPGVVYQFRVDPDGQMWFPFMSEGLAECHGCSASEAMQDAEAVFSLMEPDDRQHVMSTMETSRATMTPWEETYRIQHPVKGLRWLHGRSTPPRDTDGGTTWHGYLEDVTVTQRAHEKLQQAACILEASQDGILITDEFHRIVEVNEAFALMLGVTEHSLLGQPASATLLNGDSENLAQGIIASLGAPEGRWSGQLKLRTATDQPVFVQAIISTIRTDARAPDRHVAICRDITPRVRREKELRQQANYDPLTGMANRRMLSDRLAQSIRRTRFSGEPFVLGMLDLDRFKAINDRFGHDAGDEVLCEVARRLSGSVREEDMVARLGGDEFVILLCHCQSEMQVFDRLLSLIKEPIPVGKNGERAQVGASLGLTRFDMDKPIEGEQLLREADQALYYAKANGRDRAAWFDDLQIPVGDMATRS